MTGGGPAHDAHVTVSRGRPADGLHGFDALRDPGHHYASVPLLGAAGARGRGLAAARRRAARHPADPARGRAGRRRAPADGRRRLDGGRRGSGGARGPVVLTLAPDPHAQVDARERAGTLTRAGFGATDQWSTWSSATGCCAGSPTGPPTSCSSPGPPERDLDELLGVDLTDPTVRGVRRRRGHRPRRDPPGSGRRAGAAGRTRTAPALLDLDALLGTLPPERRHLPLALTVGRLHPVKGMATLVETWAADPELQRRCNLLVVGGDLETPSDDEARRARRHPRRRAAVGRRAAWPAAGRPPPQPGRRGVDGRARDGRPGLAAPSGVYVSASLKEEFGIAIVEAMAVGLRRRRARRRAGPRPTSRTGLTGVLVDTTSRGGPRRCRAERALARRRPRGHRRGPTRPGPCCATGSGSTRWPRRSTASTGRSPAASQDEALGWAPARAGAGTSPRDPAGHQPRLRLAPLPPGHPGDRVAGRRRAGGRRHRAGHRRHRRGLRLRPRRTSSWVAGRTLA